MTTPEKDSVEEMARKYLEIENLFSHASKAAFIAGHAEGAKSRDADIDKVKKILEDVIKTSHEAILLMRQELIDTNLKNESITQTLSKERDAFGKRETELMSNVSTLTALLRECEGALGYYASPDNWRHSGFDYGYGTIHSNDRDYLNIEDESDINKIGGKRARETLTKLRASNLHDTMGDKKDES